MPAEAIRLLECPVCHDTLRFDDTRLACPSRHSFDIARHGYVNLLTAAPRPRTGDSAAMIAARARFLEHGHYDAILAQVVRLVQAHLPAAERCVADIGGGTGWLLSGVLRSLTDVGPGVSVDLSVHASRRAARTGSPIAAVVGDAWGRLPIATGALGAVLSFFAPRNPAEFRRILADNGIVVMVTPLAEHLAEIRPTLGLVAIEPDKDARIALAFSDDFERVEQGTVRVGRSLTHDDLADLVAMGPSSHHTDERAIAALIEQSPAITTVTMAVNVTVHRRLGRFPGA